MVEQLLLLIESFLRDIDGSLGRKFRYWFYRKRLGACGSNVIIDPGVVFQNPKCIFIDNNVWVDRHALLIAGPFNSKDRKFDHKPGRVNIVPGNICIGNGCHIAPFTVLQGHGGLILEENITIAAGAKVYTLSHHYRNVSDPGDTKRYVFSTMAPAEDQFLIVGPVVIERNSAVGLNAVVLPATTLREGTWIGANVVIGNCETTPHSVHKTHG